MKISKKHHVFFIRHLFLCYWLYVNRLGVAPPCPPALYAGILASLRARRWQAGRFVSRWSVALFFSDNPGPGRDVERLTVFFSCRAPGPDRDFFPGHGPTSLAQTGFLSAGHSPASVAPGRGLSRQGGQGGPFHECRPEPRNRNLST